MRDQFRTRMPCAVPSMIYDGHQAGPRLPRQADRLDASVVVVNPGR
jgi:hypothetical protein